MRESKIEKFLKKEIEGRGGLCFKFISGVAGVPDRLIIYQGCIFFVELKAPGKVMTKLQKAVARQIEKAGATVVALDSILDVCVLMESLDTRLLYTTMKPS